MTLAEAINVLNQHRHRGFTNWARIDRIYGGDNCGAYANDQRNGHGWVVGLLYETEVIWIAERYLEISRCEAATTPREVCLTIDDAIEILNQDQHQGRPNWRLSYCETDGGDVYMVVLSAGGGRACAVISHDDAITIARQCRVTQERDLGGFWIKQAEAASHEAAKDIAAKLRTNQAQYAEHFLGGYTPVGCSRNPNPVRP